MPRNIEAIAARLIDALPASFGSYSGSPEIDGDQVGSDVRSLIDSALKVEPTLSAAEQEAVCMTVFSYVMRRNVLARAAVARRR